MLTKVYSVKISFLLKFFKFCRWIFWNYNIVVLEKLQFSFSDLFSLHRNQTRVHSRLRPSKSVFWPDFGIKGGSERYNVKKTFFFSGLVVVFLFGLLFMRMTCLFCVRSVSRPKNNSHMCAVRSGNIEYLYNQPIRIEDDVDGVHGVDFDSVVLPNTDARVSCTEIDPDHWSISLRNHRRK